MPFTAEQLIERRRFVNGSEGAAALGLSPFFTELELYQSKIGAGHPIEETIPMMVGTALEPVAIALFERETHLEVIDRQRQFIDPTCSWRRCTVDGMAPDGWVVEAKSSGDFRGWGDGEDDVPEHYLFNAAHSLACAAKAPGVYFPVLIGGRTYRTYRVARNEELVKLVSLGEERFMDAVRHRKPPEAKTRADLQLLYPKDNGLMVAATPEIDKIAREVAQAKADKKAAEAREEAGVIAIGQFLGAYSTLRRISLEGMGTTLATFNSQERRSIDADALRAKYPDIAKEVTKSATIRVYLNKIK